MKMYIGFIGLLIIWLMLAISFINSPAGKDISYIGSTVQQDYINSLPYIVLIVVIFAPLWMVACVCIMCIEGAFDRKDT